MFLAAVIDALRTALICPGSVEFQHLKCRAHPLNAGLAGILSWSRMKQSEVFRENAENCAHLAEGANSDPAVQRFKRMQSAWLALASEQDLLYGAPTPTAEYANV